MTNFAKRIPVFIEADSKEEIAKKMAMLNFSLQRMHEIIQIDKESDKYVCWFYTDVSNPMNPIKTEADK